MFQSLKEQPADKILALMQKYKEDPERAKLIWVLAYTKR